MKQKYDAVNNPKHYDTFPGQQSIDIIRASMTHEEFVGFLKGNFLKYRLRAGEKDALQQYIDKSNWYRNKLFEVSENTTKIAEGNLEPLLSVSRGPHNV